MQQMKHSIRHAQMAPTCLPAPFLLPLVPRLLVVRDEKSMSTSSSALASTKQFDSQSFVKQFYLTRECLSKHDIAQEDNPIIQMMILRHMAVMATKSEEQVILSAKAIAIAEIPQNQWIDFVEPSDFVSAQGYRIFAYCRRKVYNFWCREIIGDISKQSVIGTNVCARIEKAIQWNSDVTDTVCLYLCKGLASFCVNDFDTAETAYNFVVENAVPGSYPHRRARKGLWEVHCARNPSFYDYHKCKDTKF
eukprot:344641_1